MKVTVTLPEFPKGKQIGVKGLGLFDNGKEREVTPEQAEAYHSLTGRTVEEAAADSSIMKVSAKKNEGGE